MNTHQNKRDELFARIREGAAEQVDQMLRDEPALVNARTDEGVSATLYSLYYREPAIADRLVELGAQLGVFEAAALGREDVLAATLTHDATLVDAYSPDGFTPLGLASFFGHFACVRLLLGRGADANKPSSNPMRVTPLHSAVAAQRLDIAEELLRHGADVHATQADEFTALHEAAQNGQVDMIEMLLRYGADPSARKSDGQTALAVALASNQSVVAAVLRRSADQATDQ